MIIARKAQFHLGYRPELEQASAYDSTPVSTLGENKSRLLVMALGIGLSIATPRPYTSVAASVHSSIACVADLTKQADEATNPSPEWEAMITNACKSPTIFESQFSGGDDKFNERSLPALSNLVQAAEQFYGNQAAQNLSVDAQRLLSQVWMDELDEMPLVPGMK